MRLRARSAGVDGQEVQAAFVPGRERSPPGFPMIVVDGDLILSLEGALTNYEVIEATPEERQILQRWGHPFGGVQ